MITLYQFAPAFGLPNASPFCMKVETYLRLAGLEYSISQVNDPSKAPKGKLPYISDEGHIVCDSHFILQYLQQKYDCRLNEGLDEQAVLSHKMLARMLDEHLYFCMLYARWIEPDQMLKTRDSFFSFLPFPLKQLIFMLARRNVRKTLQGQGLGRHQPADIYALGVEDIETTSALLADKPYFGGDQPREIDATAYAFLANLIVPDYDMPLRRAAIDHANLVAYVDRMRLRLFPELAST